MKIDIAALSESSILAGAPSGRRLYEKLLAALPAEPRTPELVLLDFGNVSVATASFLRESIIEFRNFVRGRHSNFYPVIANACSDIIDELVELTHLRSDVLMTCISDDDGNIYRHRHIGRLDPMQQIAFDLVNSQGETSAIRLAEQRYDSVKPTAWNNRLSSLSKLSLIYEISRGRSKTYRSMFFERI